MRRYFRRISCSAMRVSMKWRSQANGFRNLGMSSNIYCPFRTEKPVFLQNLSQIAQNGTSA